MSLNINSGLVRNLDNFKLLILFNAPLTSLPSEALHILRLKPLTSGDNVHCWCPLLVKSMSSGQMDVDRYLFS